MRKILFISLFCVAIGGVIWAQTQRNNDTIEITKTFTNDDFTIKASGHEGFLQFSAQTKQTNPFRDASYWFYVEIRNEDSKVIWSHDFADEMSKPIKKGHEATHMLKPYKLPMLPGEYSVVVQLREDAGTLRLNGDFHPYHIASANTSNIITVSD